jgi:hypothetical protein
MEIAAVTGASFRHSGLCRDSIGALIQEAVAMNGLLAVARSGLILVVALSTHHLHAQTVSPVTERTSLSGVWLDANRAAQGLMIEQLDSSLGAADGGLPRVGVTWFTWAPAGDPNPGPRWMFGVGRRDGDTIVVESVQLAVQGSTAFTAPEAPAQFLTWGRIEIHFPVWSSTAQNRALLSYEGPAGWGTGVREIKQITGANTAMAEGSVLDPPNSVSYFGSAGTYSDPTTVGQGWILNHYWRDDSSVADFGKRVETGLLWFSYDENRKPTWYLGIDPDLFNGIPEFPMLKAVSGGTFEGGEPLLQSWGKVFIRGSGGPPSGINCAEAKLLGLAPNFVGTPPPPVYSAIRRITRTFDPHVTLPDLCFT